MVYDNPPAYRLDQGRDGATRFRPLHVTRTRPQRAEPGPDPYHRVLRILGWVSEVARVGLIDDQRLLAALGEFEHALIAYLDTRP